MAYAAPADLIARYDERTIKDLVSDTGEPVDDVTTDDKALAALDDASGRIESAVLVGQIYTTTQLDALTGNSLALLKRLTCALAMCYLVDRRPGEAASEQWDRTKKECEEFLDRLRKGERLFNVAAAIDAGLPEVDGPTAVQYSDLNLLPDRTLNYYPSRGSRLPIGRG